MTTGPGPGGRIVLDSVNKAPYLQAKDDERAMMDLRQSVDFDQALKAAAGDFREQAVRARQAFELAEKELAEAHRDPATSGHLVPIKARALEQARAKADSLTRRSNSANAGKLRFTQDEMSDIGFMRDHAALVHQATALGKTDS